MMVKGPVPPVMVKAPLKLGTPAVQLLTDMWLIVGCGLMGERDAFWRQTVPALKCAA